MTMKKGNPLMAVSLLLITTITWGGMFPLAKHTLSVLDAFYMTSIRYGVAAVIFLFILVAVEGKKALRLENKTGSLFLLGSLGFAGFSLLAFDGLRYSSAVHAAIIMAMMPMITVLLNWAVHRRPPAPMTLLFVILAFTGVFLVVSQGNLASLTQSSIGLGDLMILAGAFCWVGYSMGAADFPGWSPLRYTALSCGLGTPVIFVCTFIADASGYIHTPGLSTLWSVSWELAYLIVLAAVVAVLCWNQGLRLLDPINGILFINLVPITAFIISALQGARFTQYEIYGALLTLSSLIANNIIMRIETLRTSEETA